MYEKAYGEYHAQEEFLKSKVNDKTFLFTDTPPEYKTAEAYEAFIKAREEDIKNINKAIEIAYAKIDTIRGTSNSFYRRLAEKFLGHNEYRK